jgi:hypothetical protein
MFVYVFTFLYIYLHMYINIGMHPGQQIIDIVLPTYRMEPEEHDRFYPSVAKRYKSI